MLGGRVRDLDLYFWLLELRRSSGQRLRGQSERGPGALRDLHGGVQRRERHERHCHLHHGGLWDRLQYELRKLRRCAVQRLRNGPENHSVELRRLRNGLLYLQRVRELRC